MSGQLGTANSTRHYVTPVTAILGYIEGALQVVVNRNGNCNLGQVGGADSSDNRFAGFFIGGAAGFDHHLNDFLKQSGLVLQSTFRPWIVAGAQRKSVEKLHRDRWQWFDALDRTGDIHGSKSSRKRRAAKVT